MQITSDMVRELREKTGAGMMDCKKALTESGGEMEGAVDILRKKGLSAAAKKASRVASEGAVAAHVGADSAALVEINCETDFVAKTDDFQQLANQLARAALAHPEAARPDELLALASLQENVQAVSGKLGENVVLKRCARLAVPGTGATGGYVHAGGRLGVIVALDTAAAGDGLDRLAKDLAMHVAAHDPSPVAIERDGVPTALLEKETEILRRQAEHEGKPPALTERIVEGRLKKFYTEVCLLEQAFVKNPDQSVRQLLEEAGKKLGQPVRVTGFVRFKLGETATE